MTTDHDILICDVTPEVQAGWINDLFESVTTHLEYDGLLGIGLGDELIFVAKHEAWKLKLEYGKILLFRNDRWHDVTESRFLMS